MTRDDVEAAVEEAERFVRRANALLKTKVPTYQSATATYKDCPWDGGGSPKESGAVRRASLDLTRALAHMRRRP